MPDYTKVNLKDDVEDAAPRAGYSPDMEARFATVSLGLEKSAMSYQRLAPGFRVPFGHRQKEQEEFYVLISGGGRAKLEDEIVEVRQWDVLRVPPETMRCFEAGPEGAELLAIGAPYKGPDPRTDGELTPGWWSD